MTALTDRQRVILDLLSEGLQDKQVAAYMGRSTETIKWHLTQIRRKLGARNTTHAVAIYLRAKRRGERVLPDGTVVDGLGNFVGIDQPAAAKASPHGNPKAVTGARRRSPDSAARPSRVRLTL